MKLIPLALYESLMKQLEEGRMPQVNSILDAPIADDLKISLFGEHKRNENREMQLQRDRPVLVKNVNEGVPIDQSQRESASPSQAGEPVRKQKEDATTRITNYLRTVGVKPSDDKGEIEMQGVAFPLTVFNHAVKQLTNAKFTRDRGTILLMKYLQSLPEIPQGIFSKGIMKAIKEGGKEDEPRTPPNQIYNDFDLNQYTPRSGRGKGRGTDGRFGLARWFQTGDGNGRVGLDRWCGY